MNSDAKEHLTVSDVTAAGKAHASVDRVISLAGCIAGLLFGARLEIPGNRVEQLAAGCELAAAARDHVLKTTGKGIGVRIAAYFQDVRPSAQVFGFGVEGHRKSTKVCGSVLAFDPRVVSEKSTFGLNLAALVFAASAADTDEVQEIESRGLETLRPGR